MTWAEKAHPEDQPIMCETYAQLAKEQDALLSPVGQIWEKVRQKAPEIGLYYLDGAHASVYGSYLVAMTHYCAVTGKSPLGLPARGRNVFRQYDPDEQRDVCVTDRQKTVVSLDQGACLAMQRIAAKEFGD